MESSIFRSRIDDIATTDLCASIFGILIHLSILFTSLTYLSTPKSYPYDLIEPSIWILLTLLILLRMLMVFSAVSLLRAVDLGPPDFMKRLNWWICVTCGVIALEIVPVGMAFIQQEYFLLVCVLPLTYNVCIIYFAYTAKRKLSFIYALRENKLVI